jgi:hypothetical protein
MHMNWYKKRLFEQWRKEAIGGMGGIRPGKGFGPRFRDIGKGLSDTGQGIYDLIKNLIESGVALKDIIKSLAQTFGGIANIPREIWWAIRKHFPPNARGRNWQEGGRYMEIYDLLP